MQLPHYLCQLFGYQYNEDGSITQEFKDAASPFPAGFVLAAALDSPPMGWLLCNGQAVSRTTYAVLFAAIGTRFGAGDGSTTFNVPDLRGRTIIGVSPTHSMGTVVGAEEVTLGISHLPSHAFTVTGRAKGAGTGSGTNEIIFDDDWTGGQVTQNTNTRGEDQPHPNMQPSFPLNYFVKT